MNLSKSKYVAGMQCPKILWMDKNMPEQKAKKDNSRVVIGNMVGDVAMSYFGDYTEVVFDRKNMNGMIEETQRLLNANTEVIAEASFSHQGNFCSVDLLRKLDDGYEIFEVKSSSATADSDPRKVEQQYLDDMAYQYYVLTNCGLDIKKVSLMVINKNYVRHGQLDLQQLFVLIDCTEQVQDMQGTIAGNIREIKTITTSNEEPLCQIGSRCDKPYECAYKDWCFRNLPEHNVYDIGWSLWGSKKDEAYQAGHVTFADVLNSQIIPLKDSQLMQVQTVVQNLPPHIEVDAIRQFLQTLTYPLYHFDFETYQQVIPLFDGVRPYQVIPFQYSIHIQETPGADPTHKEFLAKEGVDARRELSERLCADIPRNVCVLAYYASFERSRIREMAAEFPDLAGHLLQIEANILDLADPFKDGHYYCREMGGSYSIKSVLPALCPDDPELDYNSLSLIQNGGDAMNAYASLHEKSPEEVQEIRAALLAYCRLDTLAMVKVLEKLYGMV